MDKPYQDNGKVRFKTFFFFNDKMMSEHHSDPAKRKTLQSESCAKQGSFLLSLLLSSPGPFICEYFLESAKYGAEFELLVKHCYFRKSMGFGVRQASTKILTLALSNCVTLGKSLNISKPLFSHL